MAENGDSALDDVESAESADAPPSRAPAGDALPDDPVERVRAILERLVDAMDVEASVEVDEAEDEIVGRIDGEDVGLVIGRRGQTIDAVQLVCYRAAFRGRTDRKRVVVDAAGYRERRREAVEGQADRAAERALKTGKEIELDPMTPSERRIAHQHLAERSGVETFSEGQEPERAVIVAPLLSD
jgi:spoIIIJ-associated protein